MITSGLVLDKTERVKGASSTREEVKIELCCGDERFCVYYKWIQYMEECLFRVVVKTSLLHSM